MTNVDPDNGIAYGYIAAQALDPEVVVQLQYSPQATDVAFEEYLQSESAIERRAAAEAGNFNFDGLALRDRLQQGWECDEPVVEGEYEGVHYRSSWLGGALNFFILKSPYVTERARRASPCVPNAGILDTLDGSVTAYDVPAGWRAEP